MRILITGGLGFIGSHLAASLAAENHELVILDDLSTGKREHAPKGCKVIIDDVSRPGVFDGILSDVDACFHLAAIASVERSINDPKRTHAVNAGGFVNLLEAISLGKKPIPVVFASSAAVYGDNKNLPLSEQSETIPISAYGADKLACETKAGDGKNIPTIGLRFFNVYGPRQDPASPYSGVISIFAQAALQGKPITIYGDGEQSRDFIYVDDVVDAMKRAMNKLQSGDIMHGIYNVCTGKATSINMLAGRMYDIAGSKTNIAYAPARAGDIRHSLGSPELVVKELGSKAQVTLEDGLRGTLIWVKEAA